MSTSPEQNSSGTPGGPSIPGGSNAFDESQAALEAAANDAASLAADAANATKAGGPTPFVLPAFDKIQIQKQAKAIDLLSDVNLHVKIELGRTRLSVENVLKLSEGAVVELDKLAGDPVDVYVNDRYVARGEVLVLNDNFCVRINEILAPLPAPIT